MQHQRNGDVGLEPVTPMPEGSTSTSAPPFKGPAAGKSEYTDGRLPGEWKSKYPDEARRCMRLEACTLGGLLVLMSILSSIFLGMSSETLQMPVTWLAGDTSDGNVPVLSIDFQLLAVFSAGSVGGTTFSIKWLIHAAAKCKWHLD